MSKVRLLLDGSDAALPLDRLVIFLVVSLIAFLRAFSIASLAVSLVVSLATALALAPVAGMKLSPDRADTNLSLAVVFGLLGADCASLARSLKGSPSSKPKPLRRRQRAQSE